jgi:hypothetical protein
MKSGVTGQRPLHDKGFISMARVDCLLLSDLAFFDRHARLCVIGIASRLAVPSLPVSVRQIMVVARVVETLPEEAIDVGVAVLTPSGEWAISGDPDSVQIELAGEYVLVTLRDLRLTEEGTYQFAVVLDQQKPVAVELPVCVTPSRRYAEVH